MKMKNSNTSINQNKLDKTKKFDSSLSGANDSKNKNSSLESSKKNTMKYPSNINKIPNAAKESNASINQILAFRKKNRKN